jgi:hypothetical protein
MNHELDELKHIWQADQPAMTTAEVDMDAIAAKAKAQSNLLHVRFRRYLWFELALTVVLSAIIIAWAYRAGGTQSEWFYATALVAMLAPYFGFYYVTLRKINADIRWDQPLHKMLVESVAFWRRAVRVYYWGGLFLMTLGFGVVYWYYAQRPNLEFLNNWVPATQKIVVWFGCLWLLASILAWWLTDRIYGHYLRRLKQSLADLEAH